MGSGAQNSLWGVADVVPPMCTWVVLLWEWEPSLQALKITLEVPCELDSNNMNLGNQSPPQFFGLFAAGELNSSKTTWILEGVLFGLKFELEVWVEIQAQVSVLLSLPPSARHPALTPVVVAHSCISDPLKIHPH